VVKTGIEFRFRLTALKFIEAGLIRQDIDRDLIVVETLQIESQLVGAMLSRLP
jgi:hypothetical protein